jgi:uncharacterized membrane protein YeiH
MRKLRAPDGSSTFLFAAMCWVYSIVDHFYLHGTSQFLKKPGRELNNKADKLLAAVDLAGTFLFAVEGAIAAIHGHLDFLGMVVLAFVTAVGGGVIRDLLIGDVPPGAIRDWRYTTIALAGAATAFFFHQVVQEIPTMLMLTLDAAGLALFAISGAGKALDYELHPVMAIVMGGITGVGGGTLRDLLLAQVPTVLRADVYATAALLGAAILVIGLKLSTCFLLRMAAVVFHWNLPKVAG